MINVDPDWWKHLFDDVYLITDARSVCDDEITWREVNLFREMIPIKREHRILDLCGGQGRHTLELCRRGCKNCTVLDYSGYLVELGRRQAKKHGYGIEFVRGDARETLFSGGLFHHVLLLGNSLGYLSEPGADQMILQEAHRILRPGGWLLLDVTDGGFVKNNFNPNAWHEIKSDVVVCRERELRDNTICAREMVISKQNGLIRDKTYCIRFYEAASLTAMAEASGFEHIQIKVDFSPHAGGGDYGFMNHRMILTAQKP